MALIERVGSAFMSLVVDRSCAPTHDHGTDQRPQNVGILALEVYVPRDTVRHADLEVYDGVSAGKYTLGLGQKSMAFLGDREDVVSMSLTVVQSLLETYSVDVHQVGRLECGTESSLDRSKSVKTFLMSLFASSGNTDIQGVDCVNACYGGTAALFNAVNWIESRAWDGRYAIVVAADTAVYAAGPARASGGCGAVAMLIGPDAPLVLDPRWAASHMSHTYDFYKPAGLFPKVDGKLSLACYLEALDVCYQRLVQKTGTPGFSLANVDYCIMHAPFGKMVRKGFARLVRADSLRQQHALDGTGNKAGDCEAAELGSEAAAAEATGFERMAAPGTLLGSECGNMYSASLYCSLASLVFSKAASLAGSRILAYSYGSGLASSLFCIRCRDPHGRFTLASIAEKLDLQARLDRRRVATPEEFTATMAALERLHEAAGYEPSAPVDDLLPGTYYLQAVDELHRRTYLRKPQ